MKVLVFTHMYPSDQHPEAGVFVQQQVESLRREGIEVDVLNVDVKRSKWLYLWSVFTFLRYVLTHRYDLVHAHYVFAGIVARCQFRFPLVITHHGDEAFYGWQAPLCRLISRLVYHSIVVTEEIQRSVGDKRTTVIPCGVDFNLFRPVLQSQAREQLGLAPDKKLVLFVGDYTKYLKRFDIVRAAVARLQSQGWHNIDLVLAYKQPYAYVPLYMNACDVLALPSEREGSPQVVKEAMACNLPVVAAEVGDVAEVMAGIEGCYICQRTAEDVASKLAQVLTSGRRIEGRMKTQRYDSQAISRRIIGVYEQVLEDRRRSSRIVKGGIADGTAKR